MKKHDSCHRCAQFATHATIKDRDAHVRLTFFTGVNTFSKVVEDSGTGLIHRHRMSTSVRSGR